jgi:hypothetical protein
VADMIDHIISIQKYIFIKLSYIYMHEMVHMPFLAFLAYFKFEKILLCYLMQVGGFGIKNPTLLFLNISKSSAHPFSAKASMQFFCVVNLNPKISKLAWHYPTSSSPYTSHLYNLTHGIASDLYAPKSNLNLSKTHIKLLFRHLSLAKSF